MCGPMGTSIPTILNIRAFHSSEFRKTVEKGLDCFNALAPTTFSSPCSFTLVYFSSSRSQGPCLGLA